MIELKLSKRLAAIAALVPSQGGVADIGTDHGYIPVWLAQQGHDGKIVASDINDGPLECAINTAIQYSVVDKIDFALADGLNCVCGKRTRTVVIAGMGGETIATILSAAPWTRAPDKLLILQPMTKSDLLREWLFENGYKVVLEKLVEDEWVYEIIMAAGGQDEPYPPGQLLTGHRELLERSPLLAPRLEGLITKTRRAVSGLSVSARAEDAEKLCRQAKILEGLLEIQSGLSAER